MNAIARRDASGANRPEAEGLSADRPITPAGEGRGAPLPDLGHASAPDAATDGPPGGRRKLPWIAAGLAVLLAAGAGSYAWLRPPQATPRAEEPSRPEAALPRGVFQLSAAATRAGSTSRAATATSP